MNDNRRIRVFVSSTFRDMMGERDELMTHAWPELRRFCRERQVELVEVDLRWGIVEEQSRETLKLCLGNPRLPPVLHRPARRTLRLGAQRRRLYRRSQGRTTVAHE